MPERFQKDGSEKSSTTDSPAGGISGLFKSLKKSLGPSGDGRKVLAVNPIIVGGSVDQEKLLAQLYRGDLNKRSEAASKLTASIENLAISSIPEIWYGAKDMLLSSNSQKVRLRALHLFKACIDRDDLSSVPTKLSYYNDILTYCRLQPKLDDNFPEFLECLSSLTDKGQQIQELCMHAQRPLGDVLVDSLKSFPHKESRLLEYIRGCFYYNIASFGIEQIDKVLKQILVSASHTQDADQLVTLFGIVDIALVNEAVLSETLRKALGLIMGYSVTVEDTEANKALSTCFLTCIHSSKYCRVAVLTVCELAGLTSENFLQNCIGSLRCFRRLAENDIRYFVTKDMAASKSGDLVHHVLAEGLELLLLSLQQTAESSNVAAIAESMSFLAQMVDPTRDLWQVFSFRHLSSYSDAVTLWSAIDKLASRNADLLVSPRQTLFNHLQKCVESNKLDSYSECVTVLFDTHHKHLLPENVGFLARQNQENLCFVMGVDEKWQLNVSQFKERYLDCNFPIRTKVYLLNVLVESLEYARTLQDDMDEKNTVFYSEVIVFSFLQFKEMDDISVKKYLVDILWELSVSAFSNFLSRIHTDFVSCPLSVKEHILKGLITLFGKGIASGTQEGATKCTLLWEELFQVAETALEREEHSLILIICKLMVRLRTSLQGSIYLTNPKDIEGLSDTLGRNLEFSPDAKNQFSWWFPENLPYIPPDCIDRHNEHFEQLQMNKWLDLILHIIDNFVDWECFSFVWCHLCPQLANIPLFSPCESLICEVRKRVCDQLMLKLPKSLKFPTGVTKADLQVAIVRTVSALLAYHDVFAPTDAHHLVQALLVGLSSWEKTAIPCINCLTVCCYEIPLSVVKFLSPILTTLQTRITTNFASSHILEFLLGLAYVPAMTANFNADEFKRVFGIAFNFLQGSFDSEDPATPMALPGFNDEVKTETQPSTQVVSSPKLTKYNISLAYGVISSWFLKMNFEERCGLSPFITRNILLVSSNEQSAAYLDLISRLSYANVPLKMPEREKVCEKEGSTACKSWVYSNGVVSVATEKTTGKSIILVRRPTGVAEFNVTPACANEFAPEYFISQLVVTQNDTPILLADDERTRRAISILDRVPVVDFHKVGIVYIGLGQQTESPILSNVAGSTQYQKFVRDIGHLIRLKDNKTDYVGGLDTANDSDGEFAYGWGNQTIQLIFHVTTMMPNSTGDEFFALKKRHIGNNYVNIFWDESLLPFNFNILKSQFNFLSIVISPVAEGVYRVKVYRIGGVPAVFSACHFKLIKERNLALFVRNLCIIADQFASVWHSDGEYMSNWVHRTQQIKALFERAKDGEKQG